MTKHTLADVKSFFKTEKVVETATSFVVNDFGKYRPNISFVLNKDFGGDPLRYRHDQPTAEMVAGLGVDFGALEAHVAVLFGDFWLSKAGKPHFRPKPLQAATHMLLRAGWHGFGSGRKGKAEGFTYFRRAASNGGGTGYDYYVVPVGYHVVACDEELDGDSVVTPDFSARARQVRASFSAFDRAQVDKAAAEAKAKAEAEAASRAAKADLMPRLVAVQVRLDALRSGDPGTSYDKLELGDTYLIFGWGDKFYTEENVRRVEYSVGHWEEKLAYRQRRPLFEAFAPRAEALGLTLSFGEDKVSFSDDGYYGGHSYDDEGLAAFEAALIRKEEAAAEKAREEAAAAAKIAIEAEAAAIGLPSDVRIWHRMGGVTNRGCGWVIRPDGSHRPHDNSLIDRHGRERDGDLVWNQILPGELVLRYRRADRYDIAHCDVVHRPATVTREQLLVAKQIEEEMEASENAFGLDDRLSELLNRRSVAIEEAMADLPEDLQTVVDVAYELLASANGVTIAHGLVAEHWVNQREGFPLECEGREAQVVYQLPAADGTLQVVGYYKWGSWNLNLWWREEEPVDIAEQEPSGATVEDLAALFNSRRK